jgi:hypothetical protein
MRRVWLALVVAACGNPAGPLRSGPPSGTVASRAPAAPAPSGPAAPPTTPAAPSASAAVVTGSQPKKNRAFPPADVPPPSARSAVEGDGRWTPFGDAKAEDGVPLMVTTTIRPHPESKLITLTLVAIDRTRTELRFIPGVEDVGKMKVAFAPGLVPEAERPRLLAAFNGGFLPRHGRWGMRLGATTVMPPRDLGCTVLLLANGDVRLGTWSSLGAPDADIVALRQTPPCLVEAGAVHPLLTRGQDRAWGGQTPGIVTRRRSAVGLGADGRVLYYAIGVETSPKLLAQGLLAAGLHVAAELDINWNWTRFFTFSAGADGVLGVARSLVDVEHSKRDYVERASERDFFYVLRGDGSGGP